jgi:hypothetical protein
MKHAFSVVAGFVLGVAAVFALTTQTTPATPELRPPTGIAITQYPRKGMGRVDCEPVDIPPEEWNLAYTLLTPDQCFKGGVDDIIARIVAEAVITHRDGTRTSVIVREFGANPAVVSVDGRNYFFARSDPSVHDGAMRLVQLVTQAVQAKKAARQPKP